MLIKDKNAKIWHKNESKGGGLDIVLSDSSQIEANKHHIIAYSGNTNKT